MNQSDPNVECLLGTYHVVQIGDDWHVLFQPQKFPRQYLSIARFQDYERAESYANVENDMQHDMTWEQEDIHSISDLSRVPIKAIEVIKPQKQIPDINRPLSDFEQEICADLDRLMKDYPYGVSFDDLKEYYGIMEADHRVRQVMKTLHARKLARLEKWVDDPVKRLVPVHYERPPMRLTDTEKLILGALPKLLDPDGVCRVSARTIGLEAGVNTVSVLDALWRLHHKKYLVMVQADKGLSDTSTECRLVEPLRSPS